LMAAPAAASGAAERWLAERPDERDAWALHARVAVYRAVRANRRQHPDSPVLVEMARRACIEAARNWRDPVPWVTLLQLAGIPQRPGRHSAEAADDPYVLMEQLSRRHRFNREGYHRLLAAVGPEAGGSMIAVIDAARVAVSQAPAGSPLHLLPLLAHLKSYQRNAGSSYRDQVLFADREWSTAQARHEIAAAYTNWFAAPQREPDVLLPDLHLLAHALWKASMFDEAAEVFTEIGPWAYPVPWSAHGDAATYLQRARDRCLGPPQPG
ncbi:MAG TPA: hypothetical protein VGC80_12680, partial [Acetobacteraceae bacterium]